MYNGSSSKMTLPKVPKNDSFNPSGWSRPVPSNIQPVTGFTKLPPLTDLLLLPEHLKGLLELLFLGCNFINGCLVLFFICHGDHSQDQIDQVERPQEDDEHEKDHIDFPRSPQGLQIQEKEERHICRVHGPLMLSGASSKNVAMLELTLQPSTKSVWGHADQYLLVESFPGILCHEAEH